MLSLFGLGLLLGLQHALEADHVAAVMALTRTGSSSRQAMAYGATWGLGHALTLLVLGGSVLALDLELTQKTAKWMEFIVGGMLVILGVKVIIGILRERIHIHIHRHDNGTVHAHAHSHKHERSNRHQDATHQHNHIRITKKQLAQSLFVGVMHGMAGTAALVLFVVTSTMNSVALGFGYIFVFGLGSILGMAILSVAISFPSTYVAQNLPSVSLWVRATLGSATVVLGGYILTTNWI